MKVIWPNGRLLREYTLLLDPPLYAPQQVIYAPELAATPAAAARQPTSQPTRQAPASRPRAGVASTSRIAQGGEYRVQRNDTLWDIASRVKGSGSVHQAMLAIQDLNPNAFVNGNINRMKSGQVLRLPDAEDINRRTYNQAVAQVNQQIKAGKQAQAQHWQSGKWMLLVGLRPVQRPLRSKKDSLRLVSDAAGQAQLAADQGVEAEIRALQDKLARSEEFLDSTILEKEELHSRVEELSSQVEKLQRLIELKDNQLAQLQNADETTLIDVSANLTDLDDAAVAQPQLEGLGLAEEVHLDSAGDAANATPESMAVTAELAVESASEEPAPIAEQPIAVTPAPAAAQEKNILEKVFANPTLLAATGGSAVLALLLLLLGLSRSRARKKAEQETEVAESVDTPKPDAFGKPADELDQITSVTSLTAIEEAALGQEMGEPLAGFDVTAPVVETEIKEEETDPLAEAASYMGFGRFNQAADVLHKALEAEPERLELRHKLLEVYADLEDQAGFAKQVEELTEMGGTDEQLAQLKIRYPKMFAAEQVLAPV